MDGVGLAVDFDVQFARLTRKWRLCGETSKVTRILRQLQTIRLGCPATIKNGFRRQL